MATRDRMTAAEYREKILGEKPKGEGRIKGTKRKLVNGIEFDSTREARRYQDLVLMQSAGQIRNLSRQGRFPIFVEAGAGGVRTDRPAFEWIADFTYEERVEVRASVYTWVKVVEDCKGYRTDVYKLKRRCVEMAYGFKIRET